VQIKQFDEYVQKCIKEGEDEFIVRINTHEVTARYFGKRQNK
jgi:hypothetical protein